MPKRTPSHTPPSPEAIEQLIAAAGMVPEPATAAVIAKSVSPPHNLKEAVAAPLLEQAVQAGQLYGYPPKTAKGKPRFWGQDVAALIRSAVDGVIPQLDRPHTCKELLKRLPGKPTEAEVQPILQAAVRDGKLFQLPPTTAAGQPRFWIQDLKAYGRQVMLDLVRMKGPQPAVSLQKALKGFSKEQSEQVLTVALAGQELWRHPVCGKVKKELLGAIPPSPSPYLKEVSQQLEKIVPALRGAGVSTSQLRRSLLEMIEAAGVSVFSAETAASPAKSLPHEGTAATSDLIAVMKRIEPRAERGALVSVADLRKTAKISRQDFDRAVLDLARQQQLTLHRHDYPASLSQEAREELVHDGAGTYYIGVALRVNESRPHSSAAEASHSSESGVP